MSKEKKSKLDPFAERLDEWFGVEKKTIAEVQEQLKLDGCVVSSGRLSAWWQARQLVRMQAALLQQISTASAQVREVRKQFGETPAPELEELISLHRVLIFKLSSGGMVDPEFLKLADQMMRTAMEFVSGQTKARFKERELAVTEGKFRRETCELFIKWCADQRAKDIVNNTALTFDDKLDALYRSMFNEDRRPVAGGSAPTAASQPRPEGEPTS